MAKKHTTLETSIQRYINALKQKIKINKVVLYGSWAKGHSHEYSDIDLAIFSPDFGKNTLLELQLLSKLSWEIDESIEAVPYSIDKLINPELSSFVHEILKTGITVYESASI